MVPFRYVHCLPLAVVALFCVWCTASYFRVELILAAGGYGKHVTAEEEEVHILVERMQKEDLHMAGLLVAPPLPVAIGSPVVAEERSHSLKVGNSRRTQLLLIDRQQVIGHPAREGTGKGGKAPYMYAIDI